MRVATTAENTWLPDSQGSVLTCSRLCVCASAVPQSNSGKPANAQTQYKPQRVTGIVCPTATIIPFF